MQIKNSFSFIILVLITLSSCNSSHLITENYEDFDLFKLKPTKIIKGKPKVFPYVSVVKDKRGSVCFYDSVLFHLSNNSTYSMKLLKMGNLFYEKKVCSDDMGCNIVVYDTLKSTYYIVYFHKYLTSISEYIKSTKDTIYLTRYKFKNNDKIVFEKLDKMDSLKLKSAENYKNKIYLDNDTLYEEGDARIGGNQYFPINQWYMKECYILDGNFTSNWYIKFGYLIRRRCPGVNVPEPGDW